MRNLRTYYSSTISDFLNQPTAEILGVIHSNDISAETTIQQSNTWEIEVEVLKDQLRGKDDGRVIFEYTIPRMGKRVDVVVLYRNIVFLLEFKCGDTEYRASTFDQVYDYALRHLEIAAGTCWQTHTTPVCPATGASPHYL